jgi:hypothetical protein
VSKYLDHLAIYRQCEIYEREGMRLDPSTLCDWLGQAAWLLDPLVEAIRRHVFASDKIHGDDTTVPVLRPGLGRTATARLWIYVRGDRPFCGDAAPAAAYFYSPTAPAPIRGHMWQILPAFCRPTPMPGLLLCMMKRGPGPGRLPKLPAGHIADGNSSIIGSITNLRSPARRWTGLQRSTPSKPKPPSRRRTSGLRIGVTLLC